MEFLFSAGSDLLIIFRGQIVRLTGEERGGWSATGGDSGTHCVSLAVSHHNLSFTFSPTPDFMLVTPPSPPGLVQLRARDLTFSNHNLKKLIFQ